MGSGFVEWSSLPRDILSSIANLLNPDSDHHRIRAVCSAWRSSLNHLAPVSPKLSFPIEVPHPVKSNDFWFWNHDLPCRFLLNEYIVYRLSPIGGSSSNRKSCSADGWMIKVSKTYCDSTKYSLRVPLSTEKIEAPIGSLPKTLNRLLYDVTEICRSYSIEFLNFGESPPTSCASVHTRRTLVLWSYVTACDFVVLMLGYCGTIKFWRSGDTDWTQMETDEDYHFDDVVLFKEKCYAIDKSGRLFLIDSSLRPVEVVPSFGNHPQQDNNLVVGLDSELYVVVKIPFPDPDFCFYDRFPEVDAWMIDMPIWLSVFKLNKETNEWEHTNNVGDQVFILGDDVTFCVFARDFKGCKGNCVYLTYECCMEDDEGDAYGEDTGMYDLTTSKIVTLAVRQDYAAFFCPPPSWLVMDDGSSGKTRGEGKDGVHAYSVEGFQAEQEDK